MQTVHCLCDVTSNLLVNRPPNTKGAPNNTAVVGADVPSPAKPHVLAIELLATTTPSAADNVNMGSPPAPTSDDKKLADAAGQPEQITDSCKVRGHPNCELSALDVCADLHLASATAQFLRWQCFVVCCRSGLKCLGSACTVCFIGSAVGRVCSRHPITGLVQHRTTSRRSAADPRLLWMSSARRVPLWRPAALP